jgi:hypothetical protein
MSAPHLRDNDTVRQAQARLRDAKSKFSKVAVAALRGKATAEEAASALREVDAARNALRAVELGGRGP